MASSYTIKKIHEIISKCIQCRKCMSECIMLNEFTKSPKMLFMQYEAEGPDNMDHMIAYSCNECGQCTLKCPKKINLKEVFQSLKADYAEENEGLVPLEQLIPSEKGQVLECSKEYCTTITASATAESKKPKTKYILITGDAVPASYQEAVDHALTHLKESLGSENVGLLPEAVPEALASMGAEVLITLSPSVFRSCSNVCTEHRVISYWDLMQRLIDIPKSAIDIGKNSETVCSIYEDANGSIQWALDRMGYRWTKQETDYTALEDLNAYVVLDLLKGSQSVLYSY